MVLNMLDQRSINKVDALDPAKYSFTQQKLEAMLIGELDFLICDDIFVLDTELLQACRQEAQALGKQEDLMLEAGFGRGIEYSKDKKVRGDKFLWLTQAIDGEQQLDGISNIKVLVERLTPIRDAINT